MSEIIIKSAIEVTPKIYAYTTPYVTTHNGWTKIGYTEKDVIERIEEQTNTVDVDFILEWDRDAMYTDGSGQYFNKDYDFHAYLERNGIERKREIGRDGKEKIKEWFHVEGQESLTWFSKFASRGDAKSEQLEYILRAEQEEAVSKTEKYFSDGGDEFLWNAKPRFGKTLVAYDLVDRMACSNVLIVTNRPSIANSWWEDFKKYFYWREDYEFVTETRALQFEKAVISREEYVRRQKNGSMKNMVAFVSLQDLKGSKYFGGKKEKLKWMARNEDDTPFTFDLLIVDEAHEGVDTILTEKAFRYINKKYTLYLSGTPFKALARNRFDSDQIYSWSYSDEQEAKLNWGESDQKENTNPYEDLPRLAMFTYRLPSMVEGACAPTVNLTAEDEKSEFTIDLDEFFATDSHQNFIHETEVRAFLHTLSHGDKFPFSSDELRTEMSHTLWLFSRINSCKAMEKLLGDDPVFKEYKVVRAYGPEHSIENDRDKIYKTSYDRVKDAIKHNPKTITLSVGQLTLGVTVPEWSGILMLCNLRSASAYMQAAFRVQNPCLFSRNGREWRKETAYVFDFDPARSLVLYDEFANNLLSGGGSVNPEERSRNVERLLSYFPIAGENVDGGMVELDAQQVLSIPRTMKSDEVVSRGFLCNYLFQNISRIYGGPPEMRKIIKKLPTAKVGARAKADASDEVTVDENGEVTVSQNTVMTTVDDVLSGGTCDSFTYELGGSLSSLFEYLSSGSEIKPDDVADKIYDCMEDIVVNPVAEKYSAGKNAVKNIKKTTKKNIHDAVEDIVDRHNERVRTANEKFEKARKVTNSEDERIAAENELKAETEEAQKNLREGLQNISGDILRENAVEIVTQFEKNKNNAIKQTKEDEVRAHLRGFSRTIPSFLMAYGDENTTLANFGDNVKASVFKEVTGITKEEFHKLRDEGKLFDEVVFNDSVEKFLKKKDELRNYFDGSLKENIFDYIPSQKNNQIFTPRKTVVDMVNMLGKENEGCFDDDANTFADLYMKSGLYITEIVKRLFNSEKMKKLHPDDDERIKHILTKQVYGMAPNEIIYRIATNYIFGFDKSMEIDKSNFVIEDAAKAAKEGKLEEKVKEHFGRKLGAE